MHEENKQIQEVLKNIIYFKNNKSQFIQKVEKFFGNRVIDIFMHSPKDFIFRKLWTDRVVADDIINHKLISVDLKVLEVKISYNKKMPAKIITTNSLGQIFKILYFNTSSKIIQNMYQEGKKYRITGNFKKFLNFFQIIHPENVIEENNFNKFESIEPIYNLGRNSINKKAFRKLILNYKESLKSLTLPREWIDNNIINKYEWLDFKNSLYKLHFPSTTNVNDKFRKRLAFDEILSNFLIISKLKRNKIQNRYYKVNDFSASNKIIKNLNFSLTTCQIKAVSDIQKDFKSKKMFRLVQGDVGSGKTIVAALAISDAVNSGLQVAIMVPTDILANQHYNYFLELFNKLKFKITLLTGKLTIREKNKIYDDLKLGKIHILIGTHSIFNKSIEFKKLGLIVIDEQHKFGVNQRLTLQKKNQDSHILIMSATPIPRSLTFAVYGEIDLSLIKIKPPGRKHIDTIVISNEKILDLINGIKRKINKREKIFWVVPEIGKDEEESKRQNVLSRKKFLQKYFYEEMAYVHGKMKKSEINEIMKNFRNENIMILLSTSLIEVGIDIPSASAIIIEHADKFGLAQLHQLRGRVGRGKIKSDCVLLHHNDVSDKGLKRLSVMKNSNDGFFIAEQDLLIRGSGEIFGIKQTGLPSWKFFNPYQDMDFLEDVRSHSKKILNDPLSNKNQLEFLTSIFFHNKKIDNYFTG